MARPDYREYLGSEKWQRVRHATFRAAGGRCERCGGKARQVHHRTYSHLGAERPGDTQALCFKCHKEVHGKEWPPVVASRMEERDGRVFVVKTIEPAPEWPNSRQRNTTHRRRKRNIRK
jgi:hypothetical protein